MKDILFFFLFFYIGQINGQIISTIAGNGTVGYNGDGGPATAAELIPHGVTFDAKGNLYIAGGNYIRKIDTSGIITTFAGNGTNGYSGDGGLAIAASLSSNPRGVAFDNFGNLYIADAMNWRIRKVDVAGIITTFAGTGTGGYSGDGGLATAAQIGEIDGLTFDSLGNLFLADFSYNRIRKINSSGIITTIVGNGTGGFNGDSGLATNA